MSSTGVGPPPDHLPAVGKSIKTIHAGSVGSRRFTSGEGCTCPPLMSNGCNRAMRGGQISRVGVRSSPKRQASTSWVMKFCTSRIVEKRESPRHLSGRMNASGCFRAGEAMRCRVLRGEWRARNTSAFATATRTRNGPCEMHRVLSPNHRGAGAGCWIPLNGSCLAIGAHCWPCSSC